MTQPPQTAAGGPDRIGPGMQLADRYAVLEIVGYGGMATVYHGRDTLLDRDVAIKVLNQRIAPNDASDRQAFLREARAAASLSHPGIATTYDAGIYADWPYIVMEYVPGRSLKQIIDEQAPLPPQEAIGIAIKLADALEYGHRHGVVHCDVKPQNVLVGRAGEPKLVDFGISQTVAATAALTSTVSGTAGYVAPEQLEGLPLDGRADVYSLGTVLYQMLTKQLPFEAPNLTALATRRLIAPPRPIRELNPAIPQPLADIVMRSIARDRDRRFPSAGELANALRAYQSGFTSQATFVQAANAAGVDALADSPPVGAREFTQVWRRPAPVAGAPVEIPGQARSGLFWFLAALLVLILGGLIVALVVVLPGRSGGGAVTVPQVTNTRLDDAARTIQSAGLKVAVTVVQSDQPVGTVLKQDPQPNTTLSANSYVTLTVSGGASP